MHSHNDIVLVQIPRMNPLPAMGIWLLHEQLIQAGYKSEVYDANLNAHSKYAQTAHWSDLEKWGIQQKTLNQVDQSLGNIIKNLTESWADEILSKTSRVVGISVFSIESRNWCQWLCLALRKKSTDIQILLGGKGLNEPGLGTAVWAENMLDWKLCDCYLNGESEYEIVPFMQGLSDKVNDPSHFFINDNLFRTKFVAMTPEIHKNYRITNNWYEGLDSPQHPNIEIDQNNPTLRTYSTRGCVKRCTFCDVHLLRPKFSIRAADNLVDEIKYAIEEHHVRHVVFSDEMINGSNRQFIDWLELLAKYLDDNGIHDFSWKSQFGIKSRKSTPIDMFYLCHRTGARLAIGVDHFSDAVLKHMQKKYTSDDIYWYFDNWMKNPIKIDPLLLVCGYPTETLEDYKILKSALSDIHRYKSIIELIDLGNLCSIPVGSVLETMPGLKLGKSRLDWFYEHNADLTKDEKIRRRQELDDIIESQNIINRKKRTYWLRIEAWFGQ